MNVVEASLKDIPAIIQLNEEVQQIHVDLFPEFFKVAEPLALQQFYTTWLKEENSSIFIAYDENELAGYLACKIIQRPENAFAYARNSIYIDQICVTAAKRGKGVGKALVNQIIQLAKSKQIDRIELDYWLENEQAGQAFKALGFKPFFQKMSLSVK